MTEAEARKAKVGTRVKWCSAEEYGRIVEKGDAGIRVRWDDKDETVYLFVAGASLSCVEAVKSSLVKCPRCGGMVQRMHDGRLIAHFSRKVVDKVERTGRPLRAGPSAWCVKPLVRFNGE